VRVGILGGVFNPPHLGHLVCAGEACEQLGLDGVMLVPAGEPPHRRVEDDPGSEVRVELCERAVAGDDRLSVSRIEVDRPGPSYTADTLHALNERLPAASLVLVLGADQAARLPEWHRPDDVLQVAIVAVAEREGARREEVRRAVTGLEGADRVRFFDMPRIDLSSTEVRRRARAGRPLRHLVPPGVEELIGERNLYRASTAAAAS
jgi:nicotinate-nucleotide adenylyltransferase